MLNSRKITSDSIFCSFAYIYLTLPVCIFMLGWLKPIFAIPSVILVVFCLFRILLSIHRVPVYRTSSFYRVTQSQNWSLHS